MRGPLTDVMGVATFIGAVEPRGDDNPVHARNTSVLRNVHDSSANAGLIPNAIRLETSKRLAVQNFADSSDLGDIGHAKRKSLQVDKIEALDTILLPKLSDRMSRPSFQRLHLVSNNSDRRGIVALSQIDANRPPVDSARGDAPPIIGRARGDDCSGVYGHSGARSLSKMPSIILAGNACIRSS